MNVSIWISRKLQLRGSRGSNTGVVIAIAGVALAVIIMEFTLAIVVGFKNSIKDRLTGFDAQLTVCPSDGNYIKATADIVESIDSRLPDAEIRLAMRQPALLKTDNDFEGIILLAQSTESDLAFEKDNVVEGEWPDYACDSCDNKIVVSVPTAAALGVSTGDKVYTTFFVDGGIKMRRYSVAALYQSNFGEYDRNIAYASLRSLQHVAGVDSLTGNRIDIRGLDNDKLDILAAKLQTALVSDAAAGKLDAYYPVDSILRSGTLYFNWLSLLDTNVTVIFILMLCVAGFTLISSLFILILERVSMIGTLRAIGASKSMVQYIFVDIAMRIVGRGMLIGNIIGIGLLLVQKHTHIIPLDPDMYYLNAVPVDINVATIILLNVGITLTAWLILLLPARFASTIDPAKTIKFE